MTASHVQVPWYGWPFWFVWRLLALAVNVTGRVLAVVSGFCLMVLGAVLTFTVVGAIIGVPVAIIGLLLAIRGFY